MKFSFVLICLLSLLFLNSCGLIFTKFRNTVEIITEPAGAKVYHKDSLIGVTPDKFTFEDLGNVRTIDLKIEKENYVVNVLELSTETHNTQKTFDMLAFFCPYIISEVVTSYNGFSMKKYDLVLRQIDTSQIDTSNKDNNVTVKINPFIEQKIRENKVLENKINFATDFNNLNPNYTPNSTFYIDFLPFVFINGGVVVFNVNHYIYLNNLYKDKETRLDLGLRSGWGYNINYQLHKENISRGYYILPSLSYEVVTSYSLSNQYILSVGPSYYNNWHVVSMFGNQDGNTTKTYNKYTDKGFALNFDLQYLRKDYIDNCVYGFSAGYLNKSQYFKFSYGYFIY